MSDCQVCSQPLQEGYGFCHFCGAPVGGDGAEARGPSRTDLVELVDKFKDLSGRSKDLASSANRTLDLWLGSPISLQRQVLYALISGFAIVSASPKWPGLTVWLTAWLLTAAFLVMPISYWTTGVMPLAGVVNAILGGELSLRRRLLFSLVLALPLIGATAPTTNPPSSIAEAQLEAAAVAERIENLEVNPLAFIGVYLVIFYFMGFAMSWRPIHNLESSITQERMAARAATIADQIHASLEKQRIPGLEVSRVKMAKLRRYTAGESSGTEGEQLSFVRGKARVVVFVQDFGDGLFVRWAGFYDASGRRLWLYIGYLVSALDRLTRHWTGTSFLESTYQVSAALSPAMRNQILLRASRGGIISRALRLVEGVSEYSWNEIYALAGTVRETVIAVLQSAVGTHEEAERIRAQIEGQLDRERRSTASVTGSGEGRR
jgi:hypothetical protein